MSVIARTESSRFAAARMFYRDVLGGRQLRRRAADNESGLLRFRVGGSLVTTGPGQSNDRVALVVDDAVTVAVRCWDAGFTVRVHDSADATAIAVVDPFERELELVSSTPGGRGARRLAFTPPASTTPGRRGSPPTVRAG